MPATGVLMGTPASISASVEPQMDAWLVEPLEREHLGHARRMAYGNSSTAGHARAAGRARQERRGRSRGGPGCGAHAPRPRNRAGSCSGAYTASSGSSEMSSMHLRVPQAGPSVTARQHLGLAAGEHAGAVYAGQQAHFGGQRADLVHAAAVHALTARPAASGAPRTSASCTCSSSMVAAPHCSAYFSSSSLRMGSSRASRTVLSSVSMAALKASR